MNLSLVIESEKNENFPGSKICHSKPFRITRVNDNIFDFTTNVRKTKQCNVILENVHKNVYNIQRIYQTNGLSGRFLDYPDSLWIVQTASRLSGQPLDCPDSF